MYYFIIGLKIYAAINAVAILGIMIFPKKVEELYEKFLQLISSDIFFKSTEKLAEDLDNVDLKAIIQDFKELINYYKTIKQVRHGQWKPEKFRTGTIQYRCSECHVLFDQDYNCCPHCGAHMNEKPSDFVGILTEDLPTECAENSHFFDIKTEKHYVFKNKEWQEMKGDTYGKTD